MDLQYYRYFLSIAEHRSISKAAEALFVSQPYLSKVLSRLESELEVALLDRSTLPIRLTADGECLRYYAQQMLQLETHMRGELSHARSRELPALALGTPPFPEVHTMPPVLARMARIYPHTQFRLVSAPLADLMGQLKAGALHVVFALQHPVMSGALTTPVVQDRLLLALPPEHQMYRPERAGMVSPPWFSWSELSGSPFILPPPHSISRQSQDLLLASLGIRPHVVMESGSPDAVAALAASGLGLAFVPETAACAVDRSRQLAYLSIDHPLTYHTLVLAYYQPSPCLKPLTEALQDVYRGRRLPPFLSSSP